MLHIAGVGLLLFGMWLLLSGHYNLLLISLGLISVLITLYLSHRMDVIDREGHPVHLTWKILCYFPWLIWQVVVSNIDVAKRILSVRPEISPTRTWIDTNQKTDIGKVIYANSITLTPGTIAIDIKDNKIEIHALTAAAAEDLHKGEMDRKVACLMGEHNV